MKRLVRLGGVDRDVDEELAFHFASVVDDLVARGWSRADAEREAHRRFGDERRYRQELKTIDRSMERRMKWSDRLEAIGAAVRLAVRGLVRTPALTLGVVVVFALGIGANVTMLSIIDRLLLRPPDHFVAADQVHRVVVDRYLDFLGERVQGESMTYPDYLDLRASDAFTAVAAHATRDLVVGSGTAAHDVSASLVTGDYFALAGARPAVGRFFTAEEARIGGERVAVLGHGYWQSHFGGERDVVGRALDLGTGSYTIIGVAPRGMTNVDLRGVQLWLPLEVAQADIAGTTWQESRNWWWLRTLVRRADGVSVERASSEATALHLAGREVQIAADEYGDDARLELYPLIAAALPDAGSESTVAKWLTGVAMIVLLIACINVANLLFARMLRRQREVGIRLALGVTRARLVGGIVLEGLLLGTLGGLAAIAVGHWAGGALRRVLLPDVAWNELQLSTTVLIASALLAIVAGVASALVPALQAARRDVNDVLRGSSGGITRSALRTRTVLSFAQAALSVMLLVGAGLFIRSVSNISALDHGFDPDRVAFANIITPRGSIEPAERIDINWNALERLRALPGVENAAFTSAMPFWSYTSTDVNIEGVDSLPRLASGGPYLQVVSHEYLPTMGLDLRRGRLPGASEFGIVVNETLADAIAPSGEVLGRCMYLRPDSESALPCAPITGIAENATRSNLEEDETMQYYVHAPRGMAGLNDDVGSATVVIRVRGSVDDLRPALQRELLALDPRHRFVDIIALADRMAPLYRSWELGATLLSVFGLLALLVAGIGLYSVLAFDVTQRTRELGLRSALGAPMPRLVAMIVARGMRVTAAGVAAGLVGAALLAPRIEELLFGVSAYDPATYLTVAAVLLLVALIASWLPARRATRIDPNLALRAD